MVYDDLGYEHEADIFANQMKYVKPLLPYEIFMANIEAGNDKQLIIRDLVESYDLTIASTTTPGGICAVATLETSTTIRLPYARPCHPSHCSHMGRASQSFSANMMNGLARFLNAYGDAIKMMYLRKSSERYPSRNSPALQRTGVPAHSDLRKPY